MSERKSTDGLEMKLVGPMKVADESKGEVTAAAGRLNEVDHGKDVIPDGAFQDGAPVKLSAYGHSSILGQIDGTGATDAPVGKGVMRIEGGEMVFRGKYFMNTARGREAFETTKAMGSEQEWSLGFRKLKVDTPSAEWKARGAQRILSKIEPIEVSPVTMGEAIGTRTLSAKCSECGNDGTAQAAVQRLSSAIEAHAAAVKAEELYKSAEQEALDALKAKESSEAKAALARAQQLTAEAKAEFERFHRNMSRYRS